MSNDFESLPNVIGYCGHCGCEIYEGDLRYIGDGGLLLHRDCLLDNLNLHFGLDAIASRFSLDAQYD